jgi:signal transduction histidine kinase
VGILNLGYDRAGAFTAGQVEIAREVGRHVAISIQQGRLQGQLEKSRNRLLLLARRLVTTREDERQKFFRELHEEVAQTLSAVKVRLQLLGEELTGLRGTPTQHLREVMGNIDSLLEKTQALAYTLRPPLLGVLGPATAFEGLCRMLEKRSGVRIDYRRTGLRQLPELTAITLYRALEEALDEALRHTGVRRIRVAFRTSEKNALLSVEDDGRVSEADASLRQQLHGDLFSMGEIIDILGGSLRVTSQPGSGTRVTARFPLDLSPG